MLSGKKVRGSEGKIKSSDVRSDQSGPEAGEGRRCAYAGLEHPFGYV